MVGLVVEAPLADDEVCPRVLDSGDHLLELCPLVLLQLLVLFHARDVELVLGLWARGLEGTREDGQLGVLDAPRHLRVRHVLVDHHALDEGCILERTPDLSVDLDELKVDVPTFQIGNRENGIDRDLCEQLGRLRNAGGGEGPREIHAVSIREKRLVGR